MVSEHKGSCHCGGVRFTVIHDPEELTTCDCSLCVKRNAVMAKVPEAALRIDRGQELLATYQWNTMRAEHRFCTRCGIYVFHLRISSEARRARPLRRERVLPGRVRSRLAAGSRD